MNILHLCDEYPPCTHGGIGTVTQTLAREMVRKGHRVFVCGFYPFFRPGLPYENDQGVQVFRRFYGSWLTLQLSRRQLSGSLINIEGDFNAYTRWLRAFVKEHEIDVIEIPDFNEAFRYSGPRFISYPDFDIPTVVKLHGNYTLLAYLRNAGLSNGRLIRKKEQRLLQSASKTIAVSQFTKSTVSKVFGFNGSTEVIPNGIAQNSSARYRGDSENVVVFAGRLSEAKGLFSLVTAWRKVISKIPSAKLVLYGNGGARDLRRLKKLISGDRIRSVETAGFIGRDELAKVYRSASCAVFPSYVENFSLAPMEAMQVGCPTIFTKRSSGPELITHGDNGMLVDPDDTDGVAEAIISMLTDRGSALRMGRRGAQTIRERFDISVIADQHLGLYQSLL